jgi:hypothetical protein
VTEKSDTDFLTGSLLADSEDSELGSIFRNRFGRSLRIKPNLVKFRFVIEPLYDFKVP